MGGRAYCKHMAGAVFVLCHLSSMYNHVTLFENGFDSFCMVCSHSFSHVSHSGEGWGCGCIKLNARLAGGGGDASSNSVYMLVLGTYHHLAGRLSTSRNIKHQGFKLFEKWPNPSDRQTA